MDLQSQDQAIVDLSLLLLHAPGVRLVHVLSSKIP